MSGGNAFSIDEDTAFEIVVEKTGNAAAFEVPENWTYEVQTVNDVIVQLLTPPRVANRAFRIPVITFHDVAMNAPSCFSTFFSFCRTSGVCPELDTSYAQFHLTAPGHMPDSPDVAQSTSFDVSTMAKTVCEIIERFQLRRVIGIGFGLGGSILTCAALEKPKSFAGLMLVSPLFYASSFVERTFSSADALYTKGIGLGRRAKDRLLERWLSQATRDNNYDLTQTIEDELDRLNIPNMVRFFVAGIERPDISAKLEQLKTRTLLVSGRESPLRFHSEDAYSSFNPATVTRLDIADMGSLVLEESPEKVARALSLYLQGFGEYSA